MSKTQKKNVPTGNGIRVRFAPSPTGDLHVGGVRTALFNWLFARHNGGKFLLRIEDTDRKRSTREALNVILDGLKWMGLDHDEEIVFQSQRLAGHRVAALKLLDEGRAYRCFCTPADRQKARDEAERTKQAYNYDRRCYNLSRAEIESRLQAGTPWALRLFVPDEEITYNDGVHGEIRVGGSEIEDFVILRSDGTPTYMIAVVVDDHEMGITHIIRGDDHVSNTSKQILLYRALGWEIPEFSHVPLLLGPDKRRLSKRHSATSIMEYREAGFLPETLLNYLGLLGWSPGDDRNEISRQELIDLFTIKGIIPNASVFDEAKLKWLNGLYIGKMEYETVAEDLYKTAAEFHASGKLDHEPGRDEIRSAWNLLQNRIHTLRELFEAGNYFFQDPVSYDPKGVRKHFQPDGAAEMLEKLKDGFEKLPTFDVEAVEKLIRDRAEEWGSGAGRLIHPLRLAVSGQTGGPGMFDLLAALGRECVVRRVGRAADLIRSQTIPLTEKS